MKIVDKLIQLMIGVTDMEKSKQFYAETMGFTVVADFGKGDRHWVTLNFPDGGVTFVLTTYLGGILQPGTMTLYLATADLEQAYNEVTSRGVELTNPITDDLYGPGSGVKWFSVADPDGNNLMIVQA